MLQPDDTRTVCQVRLHEPVVENRGGMSEHDNEKEFPDNHGTCYHVRLQWKCLRA